MLNHFDQNGNAIMVDVSDKQVTHRTATATGSIQVNEEILAHILHHQVEKGDVLNVARIAGIMAVKKTSELIPMCHPLMLTKTSIDYSIDEKTSRITANCVVKTDGKTGVEMEALTGVQICLLTIFDMCKAIDKNMVIQDVFVVEKTGGKSGTFTHQKPI